MDFQYWYLFPVGIVVAAIANGAGVGGATFFSPLFVLVLKLQPQVAIGTALITEVFGFASGVIAHARARAIDWRLARSLLMASVPAAIVGSLLGGVVSPTILKVLLGLGLIGVAVAFIGHHVSEAEDAAIARGEGVIEPALPRSITTSDGQTYEYRVCRRSEGRLFSGVGGAFVGLISTGLGEANTYALVKRCRVPTRITVATGVVVVAVTALVASVTHLIDFVQTGGDAITTVRNIVIFTVPGVIVGGQLGPVVTRRVSERTLIRSLGWLFLFIAIVTLGEAALA
ncbi:MAG: sulfite exporter TauE/SafE family protein [Acidimicrobiia bacterium]